ncbi:MAG: hypothetical protein LBU58_11940 [Clostridiales bacterium]|jgi:hypothetical protein|nr:hypothetical protein [Clostridiales bacterium]
MKQDVIRKANLYYEGIDRMPEAGLPIGNGRMGTLLWATGDSVHMQLNRSDVFANDGRSVSFARADTDYGHGCAFLDITFPDFGEAFGPETKQSLDIYTGLAVIEGRDVTLRFRFGLDDDVLLIELDDRRSGGAPAEVHLRPLRVGSQYIPGWRPQTNPSLLPGLSNSYVVTGNHLATSTLDLGGGGAECGGRPALRQKFEEAGFVCETEVRLAVTGRKASARFLNYSDLCVRIEPGAGRSLIYAASTSSLSEETRVAKVGAQTGKVRDAALILAGAERRGAALFHAKAAAWWGAFWEKAPLISMSSKDGEADRVSRDVTWFQYICACVSRGAYAARFGGLLFKTNGDYVMWGSMFWWHNQSCYYNALAALGMFDLLAPQLDQIVRHADAYRLAARQQWGAEGLWVPETVWFNGPAPMDAELAEEMRLLYTMKKPWAERSQVFREAAEGRNTFESRWNWIEHEGEGLMQTTLDKGVGPFGHCTHIFSTTAKIAWLFWLRYRLSADENWLRETGYPILRDAALFYVTMPQLQKGPDGKLHFSHVNNHESNWDCADPISEMSAAHGILPVAIRAAEILGTDKDLRERWQAALDDLAPFVTTRTPGALGYSEEGPELWACAAEPCVRGRVSYYHPDPFVFYDLYTLESPRDAVAESTYRHMAGARLKNLGEVTGHVHVLDKIAAAAARMGDADAVEKILPAQLAVRDNSNDFCDNQGTGYTAVLDNRLTLREGPQAIGCQRIGRVAEGLVHALCSSVPAGPGGEETLHVFAATPKSWDVEFELPARGGLWVTGAFRDGRPLRFTVRAGKAGTFAIRDPWSGKTAPHTFAANETKTFEKS